MLEKSVVQMSVAYYHAPFPTDSVIICSEIRTSEEPTHYVICTHPESAFNAINDLLGTNISAEDFKPHLDIDEYGNGLDYRSLPDENPIEIQGRLLTFIWHGHGGLSSIAYLSYFMDCLPFPDIRRIIDFCCEVFC